MSPHYFKIVQLFSLYFSIKITFVGRKRALAQLDVQLYGSSRRKFKMSSYGRIPSVFFLSRIPSTSARTRKKFCPASLVSSSMVQPSPSNSANNTGQLDTSSRPCGVLQKYMDDVSTILLNICRAVNVIRPNEQLGRIFRKMHNPNTFFIFRNILPINHLAYNGTFGLSGYSLVGITNCVIFCHRVLSFQ